LKESKKRKGALPFQNRVLWGAESVTTPRPAFKSSLELHLLALLRRKVSKDLTATAWFNNQILHIIQSQMVNIFPGNPKLYTVNLGVTTKTEISILST